MTASEKKLEYEPAGVAYPGWIAMGVLATILATALIMVALYFFYLPAAREGPIELEAFGDGPRLQTDPAGDLAALVERQTDALAKTEWRDRDAGELVIPVEAAMKLVAARGREAFAPLPDAPQAASNPGERPPGAMAPADRRANPGGGPPETTEDNP